MPAARHDLAVALHGDTPALESERSQQRGHGVAVGDTARLAVDANLQRGLVDRHVTALVDRFVSVRQVSVGPAGNWLTCGVASLVDQRVTPL